MFCYYGQTEKGSNECLFILTWTHSMHILGKSPLSSHKVTLKQTNSQKQWKMKELILFGFSLYSLFGARKIVGMTMMCNWCDVMNIM